MHVVTKVGRVMDLFILNYTEDLKINNRTLVSADGHLQM